jgi:prevent-host-death family protein
MAVRVVSASRAKNNFGEVIRRVYENEETQIIERGGLPVAAIVSMSDLERLYPESMQKLPRAASSAKRQQAWQRLSALLDKMQAGNERFSEEEVEADVLKAVEDVRHSNPVPRPGVQPTRRRRVARGASKK